MVIVSSLNGPDEEYVQEWFPQLKLKKKKKIVLIVRHKIMIDHKTISIHKNYVFHFQSREELIHFHLFGYLKKNLIQITHYMGKLFQRSTIILLNRLVCKAEGEEKKYKVRRN